MKKIPLLLTGFVILMLAVSGCQDIYSVKTDALSSGQDLLIPEGYGAVSVSLVQGSARTAIPVLDLDSNGYEIDYSFQMEIDGEFEGIALPDSNDDADKIIFFMEEGTYILEVKVYLNQLSTLVAKGTSGEFTVTAGETNPASVTVPLCPITSGDGKGALKLDVDIPEGVDVNEYTFILVPIDDFSDYLGGDENGDYTWDTPGMGWEFPYTHTDESVGYYVLVAVLSYYDSDDQSNLAVKFEAVHIYQNMTTNVDLSFTLDDFAENGGTNVNVPPVNITIEWQIDDLGEEISIHLNGDFEAGDPFTIPKNGSGTFTIVFDAGERVVSDFQWLWWDTFIDGDKFTLDASECNPGTYELLVIVTIDDKPYSKIIEIEITEDGEEEEED